MFKMEELTDVNARLGFNVGTSASSVTIDNVSVRVYDSTENSFSKNAG